MLYANSPAIQARVNAYVRKPSLCPAPLPGEPDGRQAARLENYCICASLNRVSLVNLAIRELSTPNPED